MSNGECSTSYITRTRAAAALHMCRYREYPLFYFICFFLLFFYFFFFEFPSDITSTCPLLNHIHYDSEISFYFNCTQPNRRLRIHLMIVKEKLICRKWKKKYNIYIFLYNHSTVFITSIWISLCIHSHKRTNYNWIKYFKFIEENFTWTNSAFVFVVSNTNDYFFSILFLMKI